MSTPPILSTAPCQSFCFWVSVTVAVQPYEPSAPDLWILSPVPNSEVAPKSVRAAVWTSAYALLMLARSTASLDFSNCVVKIGILIATKTPMIATTTSSSAIMNYIASKTDPSSYNLTCLLNSNRYNQRIYHSAIFFGNHHFGIIYTIYRHTG